MSLGQFKSASVKQSTQEYLLCTRGIHVKNMQSNLEATGIAEIILRIDIMELPIARERPLD